VDFAEAGTRGRSRPPGYVRPALPRSNPFLGRIFSLKRRENSQFGAGSAAPCVYNLSNFYPSNYDIFLTLF